MTNSQHRVVLGLLVVGVFFLFGSCLGGYFLGDDFGYVQLYSRTGLSAFPKLFVSDWSQGMWGFNTQELRPLTGVTYWVEYRLWGVNAAGYHAANLFYYVLCVTGFYLLVGETVRMFFPGRGEWIAPIAALLFMVHPSHVESAAWIAGRTDLLGGAAVLWSVYLLLRFLDTGSKAWAIAGAVVYAAGVFLKEGAVVAPGLFLACAVLSEKRSFRRLFGALAPLAGIAVVWFVLRRIAFGSAARLDWKGFSDRLSFYGDRILPLPGNAAVWVLGAVMVILVAGLVLSRFGSGWRFLAFWGVAWTLFNVLPLVAVNYASPRHVFLALAGPIVLAAAGTLLRGSLRWVALVICGGLCAYWSVGTFRELGYWERASEWSRQLAGVVRDAKAGRDDVVVFRSAPPARVWFWNWALPFALEEPFEPGFQGRFLSYPDWYCCEGLVAKRAEMVKELEGGIRGRVLAIDFDEASGRFVLR